MKPDAINLCNLQNFYFELKLILIKFNKSAKVFFELVIILLSVSFYSFRKFEIFRKKKNVAHVRQIRALSFKAEQ